jgi:hypothetical protein
MDGLAVAGTLGAELGAATGFRDGGAGASMLKLIEPFLMQVRLDK